MDIPVFCLGVKGKPQWPRAVLRLRRLISSLKIDLVHTSLYDGDIIGGLAARLSGVPVVSTLVNVAYQEEWLIDNPHLSQTKLAVTKKLLSLVYRTCHIRFIAISQCVKESATEGLGLKEERISIIYRALPSQWLEPDSKETLNVLAAQLGVKQACPLLLNVGRLMPQKGQRYLIEAMPRVVAEFPEARLLIVGEGFLRDDLIALSDRLGVKEQVIFLGTRSDVKQLLHVFPSLFEGLGVSLVEATGAGKPCVASRVGPLPEVVEDGKSGILVPPQSPDSLAEAIIRLGRDQELMQDMGQRGSQIAAQKFTIAQAAKRLETLYQGVLSDHYGVGKRPSRVEEKG
jgi:glycosyltransferase involved in cell wall biosynthesis